MTLSGELAFRLHDTHGFPIEMAYLECKERGVSVDMGGFAGAAVRAGWKARRLHAMLAEGWLSKSDAEQVRGFVAGMK